MTRIAHVGLDDLDDALIVLSAKRRAYAGVSRDGSYFHLISPNQVEVTNPETGEVLRRVDDLVCNCKGFTFHGHCYRASQALALEAGDAAGPVWARDLAPETELEKAAARG